MKNIVLPEKDFQQHIVSRLVEDNGYVERPASLFCRQFAIDEELVFRFLDATQPDKMEKIRRMYGTTPGKKTTLADSYLRGRGFEGTVAAALNSRLTASGGGLVSVLKHGFDVGPVHLDMMYTKPATSFNDALVRKYGQNIFSVMQEVEASDTERVDLVVFLNGLPVAAIELKSESAGQNWQDAVVQWRTQRDPKTRLFLFKAGCLVFFAMDTQEVCMATKLDGMKTFFLPFNRGNGEGVNAGRGNPVVEGHFGVEYMWEDILTKDTLLDIVSRFAFVDVKEKADPKQGHKSKKETLIFPRYHQLDAVRKLVADVREHGTEKNYLIQHSAGSGKTFTLAWLAYRLASLHDAQDKAVYDTVIVMTDRVVVDRQLQQAVLSLDHQRGLIAVMDDRKTSADLADALQSRYKIVVTTIQKFPYIVDQVSGLKERSFAFIIDEAHSSTAGKDMMAASRAVASGEKATPLPEGASEDELEEAAEQAFLEQIRTAGKQENMNVFAFTATPKQKTLRMFGQPNALGKYEAFHTYSMRQAIEEGFILDVLQNYVTYSTAYELCKKVEDDELYKTGEAKRQIARFVALHPTNIAQRIEIVVEHFRAAVARQLHGQAKGMVVTPSRAEALAYWKALNKYIEDKGYGMKALVAFSGKVHDGDADKDVGEADLNGIPEEQVPGAFGGGDYRLLLVANKYQTGYDEPKLCAMYVFKKLRGVAAVQTLSRLNRVCSPFSKKPVVLDFVNSYEDIQEAFKPYYTVTMLADSATPDALRTLSGKLDGYYILDPDDEDRFYRLASLKQTTGRKPSAKEQAAMNSMLERAKKRFDGLKETDKVHDRKECLLCIRRFVKLYEFLILVSDFEDYGMHRRYVFLNMLEKMLEVGEPGEGFDLKDKLETEYIVQKKTGEHEDEKLEVVDPVLTMPDPGSISLTEDEEKTLDVIIAEINSRMGTKFDRDVAVKAALQIRDILGKSDSLRLKAESNDQKTFELSYFDELDGALIDGWQQNKEFFNMLLNNEDVKKRLLGVFAGEIYRSLRGAGGRAGAVAPAP